MAIKFHGFGVILKTIYLEWNERIPKIRHAVI